MDSQEQKKYSFEKKLSVVQLYLTSEISYQELALQEGILNPSQIVKWVNDFRIAGSDALKPKKKGRKKTLKNSKRTAQKDFSNPTTTQENHQETFQQYQKITTDTTEFKYYQVNAMGHMTMHKLYLDPFMDLFNGEIFSYGIHKQPSAKNIMDVLNRAIEVTSDCPFRRTFHSDQG